MLPEFEENIAHHFSDGLYAKEMHIKAGQMILQHKHKHSHLSILTHGKVVVVRDEKPKIVQGPACINITAEEHHGIMAISDCVWFCVHATDETDSSKVDKILIGDA